MVRKQTQEELAQIFSMSLDMICIADMNSATFLKVNSSVTEILGYSEKELLGIPYLDFVHPDDIDNTRNVLEQKLQSGVKVYNFENRYRCKDRSYRWLIKDSILVTDTNRKISLIATKHSATVLVIRRKRLLVGKQPASTGAKQNF